MKATLCDFIEFISEETMFVNDPLFSKEVIEQCNEKRSSRQENTKKRINTFVTSFKKDDISGIKKLEMSVFHVEKVILWIPVNIS